MERRREADSVGLALTGAILLSQSALAPKMRRMSDTDRSRRLASVLGAILLALIAGCTGLFPAATAEAQIIPQRGIDGIALTMTRAQIVRTKGAPDDERLVRNEILGPQRMVRYDRTRAFFGGFKPDAGVVTINTRDPTERTPSGVGIGSTTAEVRHGVRGIHCRDELSVHTCFKGRFHAGERVTIFDISRRNRVSLVLIGFVID